MLALGLVLVALAAVLVTVAIVGGAAQEARFDLGAFDIETNTLVVFLMGAATLLVFVAGLELIRSGVRRARQHRHDKKELDRLSSELEEREGHRASDRASDRASERVTEHRADHAADPGTPRP